MNRDNKLQQKQKMELVRTIEQEQNNTHVAQVTVAMREETIKQTQAAVHNYEQELDIFRNEAEK